MTLAASLALALRCAPDVAPQTLLAVASAESGLDPLVIGVNGQPHVTLHATSRAQAAATAERLIAVGRNVDLGLTQINSRNLRALGLSVADAFDPCRNLQGGARILVRNYLAASGSAGGEQAALRVALSVYNTGDPARGLRNGYVARVYRAAGRVVPAIAIDAASADLPASDLEPVSLRPAPAPPHDGRGADLDPFSGQDAAPLVWPASPAGASPPNSNGAFR